MKTATIIFVVSMTAAIVIYDTFAVSHWGMDSTISALTWYASRHYPIIPFALGVVCGHLFWGKSND